MKSERVKCLDKRNLEHFLSIMGSSYNSALTYRYLFYKHDLVTWEIMADVGVYLQKSQTSHILESLKSTPPYLKSSFPLLANHPLK